MQIVYFEHAVDVNENRQFHLLMQTLGHLLDQLDYKHNLNDLLDDQLAKTHLILT